ncbi:unnamed protein product [Cyclocybe aegerita]|uniref:MYND-type domain-containing protein n=1 Tax=Cyclocybe aegerita TaxID=1973307 RepID=A0A8S0W9K7_CYCAE|nr:unnamed protein product [Cyclocybe aegerita]
MLKSDALVIPIKRHRFTHNLDCGQPIAILEAGDILNSYYPSRVIEQTIETTMATNPTISLDSAVDLLTSALQDPAKTNVCAVGLGLAADRINIALEGCTTIAARIKIVKAYPQLLRAGVKFLTFNQPRPDHVAMLNRLTTCRCNLGRTAMLRRHQPSRSRPDGQVEADNLTHLFDAVTTVSNCLILALSDRTQHKFHTASTTAGKQPWPQGPEDLLPQGPKDSILGLELWVAVPPLGYTIFKLAGHMATFHVPFAQEVIQSPDVAFAIIWPFQHLQEAIKFFEEGDPSTMLQTHFFKQPVMTIFEFFTAMVNCKPQFNWMITSRGGWCAPILARLTAILAPLPMEWSKTPHKIQHLTGYANAKIDPVTGLATVCISRESLTELQHFDLLEFAFEQMVEARKMGCYNISCPSASETIHSRLCSKCNLLRYCGERCQKDAWKCATLPHKPLCAKVHSLKESLGADNWELLWTPDCNYRQFQIMCTSKKVNEEAVKVIGRILITLRTRKFAFQSDQERDGESQIDRLRRAERWQVFRRNREEFIGSLGERARSVKVLSREEGLSLVADNTSL